MRNPLKKHKEVYTSINEDKKQMTSDWDRHAEAIDLDFYGEPRIPEDECDDYRAEHYNNYEEQE